MPRQRISVARSWVLGALLVVVLGGAGLVLAPAPGLNHPVDVSVQPGASHWSIAEELKRDGLIRSATGFELWSLLHFRDTLKAGPYRFTQAQSLPKIFSTLIRGDFATVMVTVPEGFNRFEIASELKRLHLASASVFLKVTANPSLVHTLDPAAVSLEGYLFPATYAIIPGMSPERIAARMVARFRQEVKEDFGTGSPPGGVHQWVTLASMVEKETAVPTERAVIAGVFKNRLKLGLPLQSDPTVIYAELLQGTYTGALHRSDMSTVSPYNTYLHTGLPPGPIANPGHAALMAAAHPAATPYLYFVSDGYGSHRFARTLAEQNHNVQLYIRTLDRARARARAEAR